MAFNRIVVLSVSQPPESRRLAPGTINLRLGAVRRLAYEAADCGLLSSDLAAGIRRVKGLKKNGVRMGNWLTAEQARSLWEGPDNARMKGKRDRALLALLLACGLRRHEAANLRVGRLAAKRGTLGYRGPRWQGRSYPDCSDARLGLPGAWSLAQFRFHRSWEDLSSDQPYGSSDRWTVSAKKPYGTWSGLPLRRSESLHLRRTI